MKTLKNIFQNLIMTHILITNNLYVTYISQKTTHGLCKQLYNFYMLIYKGNTKNAQNESIN